MDNSTEKTEEADPFKDELVKVFKENGGVLEKTAKELQISPAQARYMLANKFGMGIIALRKILGINKYNKSILSAQKIKKFKKVEEAFKKWGNLAEAGKELTLTAERVRQLLEEGKKYGVVTYLNPKQRRNARLEELITTISKEELIRNLFSLNLRKDVCSNLKISYEDLSDLLKYYDIDLKNYHRPMKMDKWFKEYSKFVETLGHHPTATELQSNPKGSTINGAIIRFWGSLEKFREKNGILKPKHNIHPNTIKTCIGPLKEKIKQKQIKKDLVLDLFNQRKTMTVNEISLALNYRTAVVSLYLRELLIEGKIIKKSTSGRTVLYETV